MILNLMDSVVGHRQWDVASGDLAGRGKGEKGKGEWEKGGKRKKPTLAGGPSRNEAEARDQENLLSERRKSAFQIFPRAGAQFRPSGVRLDLLLLLDQAKRRTTQNHTTTPGIKQKNINPEAPSIRFNVNTP